MLGFNNTSTLVGHFVSSPREREKRDSSGAEREGHGRKMTRNESEETRHKNIPPLPLPATRIAGLAKLSQNLMDAQHKIHAVGTTLIKTNWCFTFIYFGYHCTFI